jgi:hypothetical protein
MAKLPTLNTPVYTLDIPSTGKKIKFKPFCVKEEKILLIALQDKSLDTVMESVKALIRGCTFDAVDVDKLTTYDVEYIFLQIRMKSKGNKVELGFRCTNQVLVEEKSVECGHINYVDYDLADVKISEKTSNKIMITDTLCVQMRHPTLSDATETEKKLETDDPRVIYDIIGSYIDTIFEGETIYEFTKEELTEFIDRLSPEQFQKLKDFFGTTPKLRANIDITCKKCGYKETVILEGLSSFLA